MNANIDMHATRTARLGPTYQRHFFQQRFHFERHETNILPTDAWSRIQIDTQLIRVVQVRGAHRMRMQLNATEVNDPRESGGVIDYNFLRDPTRRKRQRRGTQPNRPVRRRAFLIERLPLGAVDKTFQHDWSIANARERAGRDGQVVTNEIEFAEFHLGSEIRLVGIRNAYFASLDREHFSFFFFASHYKTFDMVMK